MHALQWLRCLTPQRQTTTTCHTSTLASLTWAGRYSALQLLLLCTEKSTQAINHENPQLTSDVCLAWEGRVDKKVVFGYSKLN